MDFSRFLKPVFALAEMRRWAAAVWLAPGIASLLVGCSRTPPPAEPADAAPAAFPVLFADTPPEPIEARPAHVGTVPADGLPSIRLRPATASMTDAAPAPVFRPVDQRPKIAAKSLQQFDIAAYSSSRLTLYSDIPAELAASLPAQLDRLYAFWTDYFGSPFPARDGAEWTATGWLMRDADRFRAAGALPESLPQIEFGRHRGQEFWMFDQTTDYYRRHLLLHEATHCFMTSHPSGDAPLWYLEGMAEWLATHRWNDQQQLIEQFGWLPTSTLTVPGWGRIEMVQDEVAAGRALSLPQVTALSETDFARSRSTPYAWSWALCCFLNHHPRYGERFQSLGRNVAPGQFLHQLREAFAADERRLAVEWNDFIERLDYGYDVPANAFEWTPLSSSESNPDETDISVAANRGWQATSLTVQAGESWIFAAAGQVVLSQAPSEWISEPQGVSIRYAAGRPVGQLLVAVFPDASASETTPPQLEIIAVDPTRRHQWRHSGQLLVRVNDRGDSVTDNSGAFKLHCLREPE